MVARCLDELHPVTSILSFRTDAMPRWNFAVHQPRQSLYHLRVDGARIDRSWVRRHPTGLLCVDGKSAQLGVAPRMSRDPD
jgi:hypothetical protein